MVEKKLVFASLYININHNNHISKHNNQHNKHKVISEAKRSNSTKKQKLKQINIKNNQLI